MLFSLWWKHKSSPILSKLLDPLSGIHKKCQYYFQIESQAWQYCGVLLNAKADSNINKTQNICDYSSAKLSTKCVCNPSHVCVLTNCLAANSRAIKSTALQNRFDYLMLYLLILHILYGNKNCFSKYFLQLEIIKPF